MGVPGGMPMLIKSVFFYIVINMEAFIFCFVGEHLSTKVSISCKAKWIQYTTKILLYISEPKDR